MNPPTDATTTTDPTAPARRSDPPRPPAAPVDPSAAAGPPPEPQAATDTSASTHTVAGAAARILTSIDSVLAGRSDAAEIAVACLLSGGHLLIEDIPGVGKTLLAQALAGSVGGSFHRIQGTPDLLPGDVTGAMSPQGDEFELRFRPGPVFSHIVVFDELNRANPRTQSALLEATEERAVTVDGVTRPLPDPFLLIATQNPIWNRSSTSVISWPRGPSWPGSTSPTRSPASSWPCSRPRARTRGYGSERRPAAVWR
jgi:hypothetical protein